MPQFQAITIYVITRMKYLRTQVLKSSQKNVDPSRQAVNTSVFETDASKAGLCANGLKNRSWSTPVLRDLIGRTYINKALSETLVLN